MSFNPFDTTRGDREMEFQETAGMVNDYEEKIQALTKELAETKAKLDSPFVCFDCGTCGPPLICPNCGEDRAKKQGYVKLNWRPGTDRPTKPGALLLLTPVGDLRVEYCGWHESFSDCRWIYASDLLGEWPEPH